MKYFVRIQTFSKPNSFRKHYFKIMKSNLSLLGLIVQNYSIVDFNPTKAFGHNELKISTWPSGISTSTVRFVVPLLSSNR
jgi:hypothetical protein